MASIGGICGFVQFGPMIGIERKASALLYSYNYYGGFDQTREPINDDFNIHSIMGISGNWGIEISGGRPGGAGSSMVGLNPRYFFHGNEKWKEYYFGAIIQQWKQDGGVTDNSYSNRFFCLQFGFVM